MNNQAELLQTILKPLLDDFTYWFERSTILLSTQNIPDLTTEEQADLLARVSQAHQEVAAAKVLFNSMGGEVGVGMDIVNQWHQLVAQCWTVSITYNRTKQKPSKPLPTES